MPTLLVDIPEKAGISMKWECLPLEIPAFAGMTMVIRQPFPISLPWTDSLWIRTKRHAHFQISRPKSRPGTLWVSQPSETMSTPAAA